MTAAELHHQAAQSYKLACSLAKARQPDADAARQPDADAAFADAYRLAREAAAAYDAQPRPERSPT